MNVPFSVSRKLVVATCLRAKSTSSGRAGIHQTGPHVALPTRDSQLMRLAGFGSCDRFIQNSLSVFQAH